LRLSFFSSIRWQIQLWHGLLLIIVTVALLFGFYRYEHVVQIRNLERELSAQLVALLPRHIAFPGSPVPPSPPTRQPNLEKDLEERGYYIGVWSARRDVRYLSPNAPPNLVPPSRMEPRPSSEGRWDGDNYEMFQVTPGGDVALVGTSGAQVEQRLRKFAAELAIIGLGVVALGGIGGWWATTRAIRPLADITATAETIAAGERDRRIPPRKSRDELARLAIVLNNTFDRLAQAYEQQVRFTADASHELRTPVSVVIAQTQTALSRERDAETYREALAVCERAGHRMKGLLADLLELSRYDAGRSDLVLRECDLAEILRESLEFIAPLAEERRASITESLSSARGRFDPGRLSHVFINLLTNALQHNPEGIPIKVALGKSGSMARIAISDSGRGIPSEALPRIFDRFHRVDKARSRATGGTGLGLAIAQTLVLAHGGTITASSTLGLGSTFEILLPCNLENNASKPA